MYATGILTSYVFFTKFEIFVRKMLRIGIEFISCCNSVKFVVQHSRHSFSPIEANNTIYEDANARSL